MKAGGTIYSIKISDAESAGFRTIAQGSAEADSDNMLLAFNFILDRVCINTHSPELSPFHIRYKTPKDESKSAVVKKGNKVFVNIVEPPILVYDAVHATIRHRANIEEPKLIDIFQRLQAIGRSNINRHSSLVDNNMKESIGAYEKAM
jgi:hypothetical protein